MFLLFLRFLPMIAIAEVKAVLPQADPHNYDENGTYHAPCGRNSRARDSR